MPLLLVRVVLHANEPGGQGPAHEQRVPCVKSLHPKAQVTSCLKEPPVVRVQVSPPKGFARGDAGAKVTVVEFTDFGCPFCKNVTPTLKQILADYPGKVKLGPLSDLTVWRSPTSARSMYAYR